MTNDIKENESYIQAQELREPLTNILGLIELLEKEPDDPFKGEVIRLLNISAQALDTATRAVINRKLPVSNTNTPSED